MTINKKLLLGVVALGLAAVSHGNAQIVVNQGDLLLGFYQNLGTSAGGNTYIYNLGKGSDWLNNTLAYKSIGNIKADLDLAFTTGWASDTTLRMSVIGGFSPTTSLPGVDPARTVYYSKGLTTFAPGSTTPWVVSLIGDRGTLSQNIGDGYLANMNAEPLGGATNGGAIVASTNTNDLTKYSAPASTGGTYFGTNLDPNASFGAGTIGTGGGGGTPYNVEAAVDLYRILNVTAGADLSAGLGGPDATKGNGQYIATFTLSSNGQLSMDTTQAVPEPSTYALLGLAGLASMAFFRRRGAKA